MAKYIKSPLNYMGGKYKILPQIYPKFPENIHHFVDLFTGGANVGVNADADTITLNDNLTFLIDLYEKLSVTSLDDVLRYIDNTIVRFGLTKLDTDAYNNFRNYYNDKQNPFDLLILIFFSFNHQVRFNNSHKYNVPFGKERSWFNKKIKDNLCQFVLALQNKNILFSRNEFDKFDLSKIGQQDFVYCDPPYLITTGTYNDGRRGFTGWGENEEKKLLETLSGLNGRRIKFALSNVLTHKGNSNQLLIEWIRTNNFNVYHISNNFTNSSYHASDRDAAHTDEALITNY